MASSPHPPTEPISDEALAKDQMSLTGFVSELCWIFFFLFCVHSCFLSTNLQILFICCSLSSPALLLSCPCPGHTAHHAETCHLFGQSLSGHHIVGAEIIVCLSNCTSFVMCFCSYAFLVNPV